MRDEVDFLHEYKAQSCLHVDAVSLGGERHTWPQYSKQNNKFAISLHYLTKAVRNGVAILHGDACKKVSYKMVPSLLVAVARHTQCIQNEIFVISFQYLKKNLREKVNFVHTFEHQVTYKLILSFLVTMVTHAHKEGR